MLVDAHATVPGMEETCSVDLSKFSCQQRNTERPDDVTAAHFKRDAVKLLNAKGCDADEGTLDMKYETQQIGLLNPEFPASKLMERGVVSNCLAPGAELADMKHRAEARCFPTTSMKEVATGRTVTAHHMRTVASLFACDITEGAMPQIEEDLKKVAAHKLLDNGYEIPYEKLECYTSVLPYL